LAGSKVNQVEQFPGDSITELSIGRDPDATILFDAVRDDMVSRRHAVIAITHGNPLGFKISDLGSSNGTFRNGEKIGSETELLPGDTVELGVGGPKFTFDVEPRPGNFVARTRLMDAAGSAATRVIDTGDDGPLRATAMLPTEPEVKPTVGRNTVMHMLSEQRQATSRVAMYALASILIVIGIVGGALYYATQTSVSEQNEKLAVQYARVEEQSNQLHKDLGANSLEIADKYANATVLIKVQWGLYDRETGKTLFHKTFCEEYTCRSSIVIPAYVRWKGKLHRWLTTEDEGHSNYKVGASGSASGFVIGDQGLILTNKHVAAGWSIDYDKYTNYETEAGPSKGVGLRFDTAERIPQFNQIPERRRQAEYEKFIRSHTFRPSEQDLRWQPDEDGGPVFANSQPLVIGDSVHQFDGKDEELVVRFPDSRMDVNARLVRASTETDAALVKIDATQSLATIPFAEGDNVKEGERVVVLGYPSFSVQNVAIIPTIEHGQARQRIEDIPHPTVTEGIISNISRPRRREGDITLVGKMGDEYQLTVTTGPGNSGGPVFNASGKVIGLLTYRSARETNVSYAVPIKFGRDLMKLQVTN
jgi:S1-C subfamily serine protease/pSer/pThr/pTyr-binding forkhead associated (FHA) protein